VGGVGEINRVKQKALRSAKVMATDSRNESTVQSVPRVRAKHAAAGKPTGMIGSTPHCPLPR
jgi:hypothetical protein